MDMFLTGLRATFDVAPIALHAAMSVVVAASAVTALTPTPRDDTVVGKLYAALEILALNIGHAKDRAPNAPKD